MAAHLLPTTSCVTPRDLSISRVGDGAVAPLKSHLPRFPTCSQSTQGPSSPLKSPAHLSSQLLQAFIVFSIHL